MKDDKEEELRRAFKEKTFISYGDRIEINEEYDLAGDITRLEGLAKEISNTTGEIFFVKESRHQGQYIECTNPRIMPDFMRCLKSNVLESIAVCFSTHKINPYVDVIVNSLNDLKESVGPLDIGRIGFNFGWFSNCYDLNDVAKNLNECTDKMRKKLHSKQFKKIISNHKRLVRKNTKSLMDYINYLFQRHSRLLVLRIDFRYKKNVMGGASLTKEDIYEMYLQANKDREDFLDNWRSNELFDGMVGYVWKLEYTNMTGFHYHMLLFFDGSQAWKDVNRAEMLGEHWVDITDGKGLYFNCNAKKKEYQFLGIGMIRHDEHEKRENLERVASYLTKTDYYANAIVPKHGRTFGRCEIFPQAIPNIPKGRPRKLTRPNISTDLQNAA